MKPTYVAIAIATLTSIAALACTSTTSTVASAPGAPTDPTGATEADAGDTPSLDAGADAAKGDGRIGTRSDKGNDTVDVDFSSHGSYSCDSVCTGAGGSCQEGGGNGVGQVSVKYNDGSGTFSSRISGCDESESYRSGNTTMTSMVCYCSDMPAPPTIRVRKSEGLFTCSKVCASWSLKCSTSRKNYSFIDERESSETRLDCDTAPDATKTHHYTCACDI
jgi:hypothetical protein